MNRIFCAVLTARRRKAALAGKSDFSVPVCARRQTRIKPKSPETISLLPFLISVSRRAK